jgi:hypothetical protein
MRAYAFLQVIEERAAVQFPLFAEAFRRAGDPATAEVFETVLKDELRHLLYCQAISRRYAPDAVTLQALLAHYRAVEARAFAENTRANLRYMVEHGYVDAGWLGEKAWLGFVALGERLGMTRPTAFSSLPAAA